MPGDLPCSHVPMEKDPRALCQGISRVPMFPWKYLFFNNVKKVRKLKRELFTIRGGSHTRAFS